MRPCYLLIVMTSALTEYAHDPRTDLYRAKFHFYHFMKPVLDQVRTGWNRAYSPRASQFSLSSAVAGYVLALLKRLNRVAPPDFHAHLSFMLWNE